LELIVVVVLLALLACILPPALARSQPTSKTFECQNNTRQLYTAWRQWAEDHNDTLVAAETLSVGNTTRPNWITGTLNWDGANPSNYNTNQDLAGSPLWNYVGTNPTVFKCPADSSYVVLATAWNGLPAGSAVPRVRTISMNCAFGKGAFLDKTYNPSQTVWRTYSKAAGIVIPAQTFVFIDENPDSINDANLNVACTGAQPGDPPTAAQIIDFPASFHGGAANVSFGDGHALTHQWLGASIRIPFQEGGTPFLNVSGGDSWPDVQWLAQNTTVKW
jgi:prepilin-type processing-associated H-X9-DG protein